MNGLGHEMIFASAGSGKTHALTTRYIRLLAFGVPPERIAALTFTRKAAGEFFREILDRLAGAAAEEKAAETLARELGRPAFHAADFLRMLRAVVSSMHRLNLGTLDGFFARIVRAFPLELGLGGEPGILDDQAAAEETRRVLGRLFTAHPSPSEEQRALIEAFRLATFGAEEKSVADRLDAFVTEYLALYRAVPQLDRWGVGARIWPGGFPWGDGREDAAHAATVLRAWAREAATGLKDVARQRWEDFCDQAAAWIPGGPRPDELEYLLRRGLEQWSEVQKGRAELMVMRQRCRLGPPECAALAVLVRRVVALELGRRLAATRGIAAVLQAFDGLYDVDVRRTGRLTFADVQQLLVPGREVRSVPTEGGEGSRLLLDYRLDARLDHWLFDEFQDTSFQQWKILEGLVDEVVQDPTGQRSLFYVGDVKQAIFTWREGDPQLFEHVGARYRGAPGGGIAVRELNDSWRSGPAVIEMVNRVCGNAGALAELFPEAASEWNQHWRTHRSARSAQTGQAALLYADDKTGRWAALREVLQEIAPTERGLTCAVLVRTNETGAALADYLRREGRIAAIAESDLQIGTDNPVVAALAALLQAAAHPGDTLARQHVAMSPLASLRAAGAGEGVEDCRATLREVQTAGFEAWIEEWGRRLEPVLAADDAFSRLRLHQLAAAARSFDATGSRDIDAFLRFLHGSVVREPEGAGLVRVMTVHKAKGLGFDVVVLPDLEGTKLAQRRSGPAVRKASDRAVDWVLQFPGETIAEHDPVLRQYLREAVADSCYEQLSWLYVALTRAKRAVYVVIEPPGKSQSRNFPRWLAATLSDQPRDVAVGRARLRGGWSVGESDWFRTDPRREPPEVGDVAKVGVAARDRPRRSARTASDERRTDLSGAELFGRASRAAADFGTKVHELLARIDWWDGGTVAAWGALRRSEGADEGPLATVCSCLAAQELRPVFARPSDRSVVWRERAFEAVLDDVWVSGVFDRVVIQDGPTGPVAAWVYDFKTDRNVGADGLRARYVHQLQRYRRVVAQLTGLPVSQITAAIVATERIEVIPIEPANR